MQNNQETLVQNDWFGFYADRVNSTYQNYFEERYKLFLDVIKFINPALIREEGCGIGSVTKALHKNGKQCFGYDLCKKMVGLSMLNNPDHYFYRDSITNHLSKKYADLAVTHGVLEHFSDEEIVYIFNRYKRENTRSVHYVPLDKYVVPSFGDERLLPYDHWLQIVKPKDYLLFNDGYDLILIN